MPTGACGINCDVCRLHVERICSSCGAGTSKAARRKLDAQQRLLGAPCPILACAQLNRVDYCLRDCDQFPCDIFSSGPYPFSRTYLNMQQRRRNKPAAAYAADGSHLGTSPEYWQRAASRQQLALCNLTLFEPAGEQVLQFDYLNETIRIDLQQRCLLRRDSGRWGLYRDDLLELVTVIYLASVKQMFPMEKDMVGIRDLKESHFFSGPHALQLSPLLERFGNDPKGFLQAGARLGGRPLSMGDAALRLMPFPRVPLYYLLWLGDAEFPARLQVLVDRPLENTLAADAIWALINRVTRSLAAA